MAAEPVEPELYARVRPSAGRRLANFGVRSIIALSAAMSLIAAIAMYAEPRTANAMIADWDTVAAADTGSTAGLIATLDEPQVRAMLTDPFFSSAGWSEFRVSVAASDRYELNLIKSGVVRDAQMMIWQWPRERLIAWSDTITLSLSSDDRVDLYAERARDVVCAGGDTAELEDMFALGPDGLTGEVVTVVAGHCDAG